MAWIYLDDRFPEHPKVVRAGGEAAWLFVCVLGYCNRHLTGGVVPKAAIAQLSDRPKPMRLAERLVEVTLLEDSGDSFMVHDYDEWNRSAEEKRKNAKKAAEARWGKKRMQSDSHADGTAEGDADAMQTHSDSHAERNADALQEQSPRVDARAAPSPKPLSQSGSELLVGAPADAVTGTTIEVQKLAARYLEAWPGKARAVRRPQCQAVIAELLPLVDASLIDEGIGQVLERGKPSHPNYLRSVVRELALAKGAYDVWPLDEAPS